MVLAIFLISCGQTQAPVEPELQTSLHLSNPEIIFVSDAANIHHEYIRGCADRIIALKDRVNDSIMSESDAVDYVVGNDKYLIPVVNLTSFTMNKHSVELGKMMKNGARSTDLFRYMDENKCRNEFNEIFVSSYIVINEEENGGLDIDWPGVGMMDAIATGLSTPAGGAACSAGFLAACIVREMQE